MGSSWVSSSGLRVVAELGGGFDLEETISLG